MGYWDIDPLKLGYLGYENPPNTPLKVKFDKIWLLSVYLNIIFTCVLNEAWVCVLHEGSTVTTSVDLNRGTGNSTLTCAYVNTT